jgi:hypothetical protein
VLGLNAGSPRKDHLPLKAAREAASQSGFDDVKKRLMVVPRCHVIRLNTITDVGGQRVSDIITERGTLTVAPDAKVIIALGTVESARLALLSFGTDGKSGDHPPRDRRDGAEE